MRRTSSLKILNHILQFINITFNKIYLRNDSTIILDWIKSDYTSFKIFVANRTAQIQSVTKPDHWNHIRTFHNSDILYRCASVDTLLSNKLWWKGPKWLQYDKHSWPNRELDTKKYLT